MGVTSVLRFAGRGVWRCIAPLAVALATPAAAQTDMPEAWTRAIAPVPLLGPITYVGTAGLGAYLIRTSAGAILIDATLAQNVPAIARNIAAAGVPLRDVKYILVTHAHYDHAAGLAALRRATGAQVIAGAGDVAALTSGIPPGETDYGVIRFTPVPVARAIRDGESVRLGGVTLHAVATPGHTPGCTTWTMRVAQQHVVFPCSVTVAGNRLFGNRRYPTIASDYRASFKRLAALPAEVVLPMHPESADVLGRAKRRALVAPGLLRRITDASRTNFERAWRKQSRIAR